MDETEVVRRYGKIVEETGSFTYADFPRDWYRSQWEAGDWTNSTDQMLCVMQSLLEQRGTINLPDIAQRLQKWNKYGFAELGDLSDNRVGSRVGSIFNHPNFVSDPHKVSREAWEGSGSNYAANGGFARCIILGILKFVLLDKVTQAAADVTKISHYDPRCAAASVALCATLAQILQNTDVQPKNNNPNNPFTKIRERARASAEKNCFPSKTKPNPSDDPKQKQFQLYFNFDGSLEELDLAPIKSRKQVLRTMACAFYCMEHCKQAGFRQMMTELILQGGDASTNGAVAGSIMGAVLGFKQLPKPWLDGLLHKDYLFTHVNRFLVLLGLQTPEQAQRKYHKHVYMQFLLRQQDEQVAQIKARKAKSKMTQLWVVGAVAIFVTAVGWVIKSKYWS
eukprot:TRINITY_DN21765_c0_g1_i1.p1 TRINITY_DN21765_c0_g1~~TRINITY_DN21765_c0_g1_i1.p1  ORF type:complete len:460 (-),score=68.17 TRINITY_DN21765_c0_g1_i1:109-1290(-)